METLDDFSPVQEGKTYIHVSHGKRLANFFIDRIVFTIISVVIMIFIMDDSYWDADVHIMDYVIEYSIFVLGYIFLEASTGQTIGKMITGNIVVTEDGLKPSFGQILGRSFARIVPFEPFSFLGNDASGWHDKWSNTKVILKSEYNPNQF